MATLALGLMLATAAACSDDDDAADGLEPLPSVTATAAATEPDGSPTAATTSSPRPSARPQATAGATTPAGSPASTTPTPSARATPQPSPTRSAAPTRASRLYTIRTVAEPGFRFRFAPATLSIRVGDRVRVVYGDTPPIAPHTWTRTQRPMTWDYDVTSDQPTTPALRFGQVGSYAFFCRPHEQQGMVGRVVVTR